MGNENAKSPGNGFYGKASLPEPSLSRSRRYSRNSDEPISTTPRSPIQSSRRASSAQRTSALASTSRESTAISLGQRIARHAAQQETLGYNASTAELIDRSLGQNFQLREELQFRPPNVDRRFLPDARAPKDITEPDYEEGEEPQEVDQGIGQSQHRHHDKQASQKFDDFSETLPWRPRRGVTFAIEDKIRRQDSSTLMLPPLRSKITSNSRPPHIDQGFSKANISDTSKRYYLSNEPDFMPTSDQRIFDVPNVSHTLTPPRPPTFQNMEGRNHLTDKRIPSLAARSTAQWLTDDDSTSGIGSSSTGSIGSRISRQQRPLALPKRPSVLPPLNFNETPVPWSDSELMPRPGHRRIPAADAIPVQANFYHLYHHGIPKKPKKTKQFRP